MPICHLGGAMSTVLVVPTYNEAEGIVTVLPRPYGEAMQLDADVSHPPQRIPALLEALHGVDVTIASWYVGGGGAVNQYRTRGQWKMTGDLVSEAMLLLLIRRRRQLTQGKHCIVDRGNTRATA